MTLSEQLRIALAEAQGWTGPWRFGNEHLHGTSPISRMPNTHVPEHIDKVARTFGIKLLQLSWGISTVRSLINESTGVAGLHLNGDLAPWSELEEGGQFEEWLVLFNDAEKVLNDQPKEK